MKILCVGAGLSGAVIARELAEAGHQVTVTEARDHIAGNCHTRRCPDTGVLEHVYGPHIFHTANPDVWVYVQRFARFRPYRHQVRATMGGRVYGMPITLHTINQFYGRAMSPTEAQAFIAAEAQDIAAPGNFEDQALAMIGRPLYEAFFKGYTEKQWGLPPSALPAAILKRLPLRFSYDDNYFAHPYQGMPEDGYTPMVAAILDHRLIDVHLDRPYSSDMQADHIFWSGPLDAWFGTDLGSLGYRTLDFERHTGTGDHQGCAVMNYTDADVPWTRVTEHKHFAPWETHDHTLWTIERARQAGADDIPYYPIRLVAEKALLKDYVARAQQETHVTFVGRLGTYRYLDMDVSIAEALETAQRFLQAPDAMPAFAVSPV
ncbi:MAG: UDP-galactopyranose mutase [Pseudomonadota bacterium]